MTEQATFARQEVQTRKVAFLAMLAGIFVEDWTAALERDPKARVWLVTWPFEEKPVIEGPTRDALAGYERIAHIGKLRAEADLFVGRSP
jgi:hypothetical protein